MGALNRIKSHLIWKATKVALRKNAPSRFAINRSNDVLEVYYTDSSGFAHFLAEAIHDSGVEGKWSADGRSFSENCSIPYSFLAAHDIIVQHYYRGWVFYYKNPIKFLLSHTTRYPIIYVTADKVRQYYFNKQELTRKDRMAVLRYITDETIKNRQYKTFAPALLTKIHSIRWVGHPDKQALLSYYSLLLDSLRESGDLILADGGSYALNPRALNTISDFEKEERRHNENRAIQNSIAMLTIIIAISTAIQALKLL